MGSGEREGLQRDMRKLLGVMNMFAISTTVDSFIGAYICKNVTKLYI